MARIHTTVEIDIDDVLCDIGRDRLIKAVEEYGYVVTKHKPVEVADNETLVEVLGAIRAGRYGDAIVMIERELSPKWKDAKSCESAYQMVKRP